MSDILEKARRLRGTVESLASEHLDDESAVENKELFPKWSSDSVSYAVGTRVQFSGMLYKCLQAHTSQPSWNPVDAASLWTRVDDPGEEWPEWRQPTGGHDAYAKDYKVSHNGRHWVSEVDNNVWEPGVYGWADATN